MTVSIELTNLSPVLTIKHVRPVNPHTNPPSDEFLKSIGTKKTLDPINDYCKRFRYASALLSFYASGTIIAAFILGGPIGAGLVTALWVLGFGILIADFKSGRTKLEMSAKGHSSELMENWT